MKPITCSQLMGNLPKERVDPQRPFNVVGTDFCGPFYIKCKHARGRFQTHKVYVCLFVCFVLKAVHLEVVFDMTSDAFLACLRRFVARRGKPYQLYSDNGTNYVGAKNVLDSWCSLLKPEDLIDVHKFCSQEGIHWKTIPPRSPNHGGLWEAEVKVFKTHLYRTLQDRNFTIEELNTCVVVIEGIINSRPLGPLSCDPKDFEPLTAGHFLTGGPIHSILEPNLEHFNENRLDRWQKLVKIQQSFWSRFSLEYLNLLQQRTKWSEIKSNVKVDDLVLLCDENSPSTRWLTGRILELFPGNDGLVRVVSVHTKKGVYKRSINKICKLPIA
jgi:hypothetical protein